MAIDLLIIYVFSVLTFFLFRFDKHLAVYSQRRIPNAVLLVFAGLFGAFGALCAMVLFRHKSSQPLFYITIPIMVAVQLTIVILWRVLMPIPIIF
jgi:uncharacterized membrane protein YsdA (DUF1294 family)